AAVSDDEGGDFEDFEEGDNFINDDDEEENENVGRVNLLDTLEALGISHEENTEWTETIARAQRRARDDLWRKHEGLWTRTPKGKEKDLGPPSLWRVPVK
ncbi:hypothetical protein H0H92_001830, partial [Tricholoma furcatifolium]